MNTFCHSAGSSREPGGAGQGGSLRRGIRPRGLAQDNRHFCRRLTHWAVRDTVVSV